jgi:hypothetical protein
MLVNDIIVASVFSFMTFLVTTVINSKSKTLQASQKRIDILEVRLEEMSTQLREVTRELEHYKTLYMESVKNQE